MKTLTADTFDFITYDAWGNEEDGFDVNDSYKSGEVEIPDIDNDQGIIDALIGAGLLKSTVTLKDVQFDNNGSDENSILINEASNGKPFCELRRKSVATGSVRKTADGLAIGDHVEIEINENNFDAGGPGGDEELAEYQSAYNGMTGTIFSFDEGDGVTIENDNQGNKVGEINTNWLKKNSAKLKHGDRITGFASVLKNNVDGILLRREASDIWLVKTANAVIPMLESEIKKTCVKYASNDDEIKDVQLLTKVLQHEVDELAGNEKGEVLARIKGLKDRAAQLIYLDITENPNYFATRESEMVVPEVIENMGEMVSADGAGSGGEMNTPGRFRGKGKPQSVMNSAAGGSQGSQSNAPFIAPGLPGQSLGMKKKAVVLQKSDFSDYGIEVGVWESLTNGSEVDEVEVEPVDVDSPSSSVILNRSDFNAYATEVGVVSALFSGEADEVGVKIVSIGSRRKAYSSPMSAQIDEILESNDGNFYRLSNEQLQYCSQHVDEFSFSLDMKDKLKEACETVGVIASCPPGLSKKVKDKVKDEYGVDGPRSYATLWKIKNEQKKGSVKSAIDSDEIWERVRQDVEDIVKRNPNMSNEVMVQILHDNNPDFAPSEIQQMVAEIQTASRRKASESSTYGPDMENGNYLHIWDNPVYDPTEDSKRVEKFNICVQELMESGMSEDEAQHKAWEEFPAVASHRRTADPRSTQLVPEMVVTDSVGEPLERNDEVVDINTNEKGVVLEIGDNEGFIEFENGTTEWVQAETLIKIGEKRIAWAYKVGDRIRVLNNNEEGFVSEIGMGFVTLQLDNGKIMVLDNDLVEKI